ncbi:MAG: rubrerythrin-like domain-containing protein [Natronomonas sp.]
MHDLLEDVTDESTYECLNCGSLVTAPTHPGDCPECSGSFQNQAMSLE